MSGFIIAPPATYFPPAVAGGSVIGATSGPTASGARMFLAGAAAGNNETVNDLIVIGDNAGKGGITNANMAGTIVLGSGAVQGASLSATTSASGLIAIGFKALQLALGRAADNVVIGNSTAATIGQQNVNNTNDQNVIIGNMALSNTIDVSGIAGSISNSVVVGHSAAAQGLANTGRSYQNSVIIGHIAQNNQNNGTGQTSINNAVIIGDSASAYLGANQDVVIGQAALSGNSNNNPGNVVIGASAFTGQHAGGTGRSVIIGTSAACGTGGYNIVIGQANSGLSAGNGGACILLCTGGTHPAVQANVNAQFALYALGQGALAFGNFASGNLIVCNASAAQGALVQTPNGATNILQLPAGTKSATNPTTSGYFYVTGANNHLHWVDSTGVDSTLGVNVAGQLAGSDVAYTNNAAAAAATITNAPVAGNPTKWIPINDNGTIRNIPAW